MKRFKLDTIYEDGRLQVIARTAVNYGTRQKLTFIKDGMEFYECEVWVIDDRECVKIPGVKKLIEADDNAISMTIHKSDIETWLGIAQENLEYVRREGTSKEDENMLRKVISALEKRLFSHQLESCPECGGNMEFTSGGMGFFFKCSKCGHRWRGGNLV